MRAQRLTTGEKIRILRDADQRGGITETCREFSIAKAICSAGCRGSARRSSGRSR